MLVVRKKSSFTGTVNELLLPITQQQLDDYESGKSGLVQDAFPDLDADQREFLITGVTKEEWDAVFGGEDQ